MDWRRATVSELQRDGILLVEDGNHGEYRPRPDEFVDRGVAFIRAADMDDGNVLFESASKINDRARQRITKGIGAPGDVLLSHKGTVGKVAFVAEDAPPFVCSPQTTFWRTLDSTRLDRHYLYSFLRSRDFHVQLASRAGETDMAPYVSLTSQRGLYVSVPPIEVQRAIARVLGTIDGKVRVNRQINSTLESIARSLFKSWFIDFDPVYDKAEGRDPGIPNHLADLFPDSFEDSELGEIPKGWTVKSLGEITSYLNRGISPSYVEESGVLVINQKCVRGGRVDTRKARRHDSNKKPISGRTLKDGDILVNSTGVGTLGRVGQVIRLDEEAIVDSHVTVVRVDETKASWNFLGLNLTNREPEIEALGEGSTGQTELSRSRLGALLLVLPPVEVLAHFDRLSLPMRQEIVTNDESSRTLSTIRDRLLPKLISGELQLPHAERIVGEDL